MGPERRSGAQKSFFFTHKNVFFYTDACPGRLQLPDRLPAPYVSTFAETGVCLCKKTTFLCVKKTFLGSLGKPIWALNAGLGLRKVFFYTQTGFFFKNCISVPSAQPTSRTRVFFSTKSAITLNSFFIIKHLYMIDLENF